MSGLGDLHLQSIISASQLLTCHLGMNHCLVVERNTPSGNRVDFVPLEDGRCRDANHNSHGTVKKCSCSHGWLRNPDGNMIQSPGPKGPILVLDAAPLPGNYSGSSGAFSPTPRPPGPRFPGRVESTQPAAQG